MLREKVTDALRVRLCSVPFEFTSSEIFAVLRGHPAVGDLELRDDGDEVTLSIGTIGHHHFNSYDRSLSEDEAANFIADEIADFIKDLIADKVLLWKTDIGGSCGWRGIDPEEKLPASGIGVSYYLWSRPLK